MTTPPSTPNKNSQLIITLREGVGVLQMILFKELRSHLSQQFPDKDVTYHSMLTGAIINELFDSQNPEEKFQKFRKENLAVIEQELLGLAQNLPALRPILTDALRVQTLCDHQEGNDNSKCLVYAEELGILISERELPLPSTFMTRIRSIGEQYGLTIPPVQITPEEDNSIIH